MSVESGTVHFNFCGFSIRGFCGLAAVCKSFVREIFDINRYTQNNGQHPTNLKT